MIRLRLLILFPALYLLYLSTAEARDAVGASPTVGAVRYSVWYAGSTQNQVITEQPDPDRIPFFLGGGADPNRTGEDQVEIAEMEIDLAANAGIAYWAFNFSQDRCGGSFISAHHAHRSALRAYLAARNSDRVRFAITLIYACFPHWGSFLDDVENIVADRRYMTVLGGRPLIFLFAQDVKWADKFGQDSAITTKMAALRERVRQKTGRNPYIVVMQPNASRAAMFMDLAGADAISLYAASVGVGRRELTFSSFVKLQLRLHEAHYRTGRPVVPTLLTGWDTRSAQQIGPQRGIEKQRNPEANWTAKPTADELRELLVSIITRLRREPNSPKTVLIYAWNELLEGGWIIPTVGGGDMRLRAIAKALHEVRTVGKIEGN